MRSIIMLYPVTIEVNRKVSIKIKFYLNNSDFLLLFLKSLYTILKQTNIKSNKRQKRIIAQQ